jgi:hypothetical protein
MIYLLGLLPTVMASSQDQAFSDIPFKLFARFIKKHFNTEISLATVLMVLFTLTSSPDLLNLHACPQKRLFVEEQSQQISGWIKALSYVLREKLGTAANELFYDSEEDESAQFSEDKTLIVISNKVNALSKLLTLDPFKEDGTLDTPLKPISEEKIEPVLLICPMAM